MRRRIEKHRPVQPLLRPPQIQPASSNPLSTESRPPVTYRLRPFPHVPDSPPETPPTSSHQPPHPLPPVRAQSTTPWPEHPPFHQTVPATRQPHPRTIPELFRSPSNTKLP